jgi:hypothetical protein
MPDYSARGAEFLREIEALAPALPPPVLASMRDLVSNYLPKRNACLEDLLRLVEDDSSGNKDNVTKWQDRCGSMRSSINGFFDKVAGSAPITEEQKARIDRWQFSAIASEDKFFSKLGSVRIASIRDYLVANRQSLTTYTGELEQKWRALVDNEKQLQSDEQRVYAEMLDRVKGSIRELAEKERTAREKAVVVAEGVRRVAADSAGAKVVGGFAKMLLAQIGITTSLQSDTIKQMAAYPAVYVDVWLATNDHILGRIRQFESLVNAEKGGVLPLFKETRRQVYEYWERNNAGRAKEMIDKGRVSLDEWLAACATDGLRDDAQRFYNDVYSRTETHLKAVQSIARDFEARWEGVFKGALAVRTCDEFVDAAGWRTRAAELASVQLGSVAESMKAKMDGYYEESFALPLTQLKELVRDSNEPEKDEVIRVVDALITQAKTEIGNRVQQMRQEIDRTRALLEGGNFPNLLAHGDMKASME